MNDNKSAGGAPLAVVDNVYVIGPQFVLAVVKGVKFKVNEAVLKL